ncbi:DUF397 domain-containing protein [Amycolatopsis sp. H20-H5]|uniref:DUF397 domain-containing protein n=1 Tax=Amycolatopsis sp. H20-H5 TaxID=3046309 RepID=UPI002DB61993|nr:DUF397 domain-containing protein [Amycolatopsis sp. H20-H5]MEC3973736.1 DUF397 domain-containing protein [Amycolatopsis sp. H20-H5]
MRDSGWFKSSYSSGNDDACVEVRWFKSSYSGGGNDECVEVAISATVGVRDTKDRDSGALDLPVTAWEAFLTRLA